MRIPHHLVRSSTGLWSFRLRGPADLHRVVERRIIKRILRTTDLRQAQVNALDLAAGYARAFALLRGLPMGWADKGVEAAGSVAVRIQSTKPARQSNTRYPAPLPLAPPARLLSVEIGDFLKDAQRRNLRSATIEAYARTLGLLQRVTGDIQASRVTHTHIQKLWDVLTWAPEDCSSNPVHANKSADQLIAEGKSGNRQRPAPLTLERHRRFLGAFFNQLKTAGAIAHSPMDAFKQAKPDLMAKSENDKRPFTDEELKRIFAPETSPSGPRNTPTDGGRP